MNKISDIEKKAAVFSGSLFLLINIRGFGLFYGAQNETYIED